jgi:cytidine deaminase
MRKTPVMRKNRNSADQMHRFSGPGTESRRMLHNVESKVLDAALTLAASLRDTNEHTVAAAAMDANGVIYTGVNVHHFTGGPCAEVVVLGVAAAAAAAAPLITMVAVGKGGQGVLAPCGRCRQVLSDYFPDIGVIMPTWPNEQGPTRVRVSSLLPGTFLRPSAGPRPRVVYFSAQYFDAVEQGRRTSTLRFNDPTPLGLATLVFEFDDGPRTLSGEVTGVRPALMQQLMDEDDTTHGAGTGEALLAASQLHYPGLSPECQMEHVSFRCLPA